jgi:preprotein translocase subunit SecA
MKPGLSSLSKSVGNALAVGRFLKRVRQSIGDISQLNDHRLSEYAKSLSFEFRCGKRSSGQKAKAFALVHTAISRCLGIELFDVQHLAGWILSRKRIAEMQTGEGKTVTAALPAFYFSLVSRQVHMATANDYLAKRDAQLLSPVFKMLGKSTAMILGSMDPSERSESYAADIVYGTASEFGFDFLKERILARGAQRERNLNADGLPRLFHTIDRHFLLIDEADSLMLDEASTPLIIGATNNNRTEAMRQAFCWADKQVTLFQMGVHYRRKEKQQIELTSAGHALIRQLSAIDDLQSFGMGELYEYIRRAIQVHNDFQLGKQYLVHDDDIVIIDQFTGRIAEGRKWQNGIHQAIQAKENLEITMASAAAARMTLQDFFLQYEAIAGMTGTAWSSRREFRKVFKKTVVRIPTNKPSRRQQLPTIVYADWQSKLEGIVQEIRNAIGGGRAVLIGTTSVRRSEQIAEYLLQHGLEHQILNAQNPAQEAEIIKNAGQSGRITVATNMAGRGTDIKIDEIVSNAGGLHVILTEIHDSARIDRQLIGRCARQGDPGTFRMMLSTEDEILKTAARQSESCASIAGENANNSLNAKSACSEKRLIQAQRRVESRKLRDRLAMLYHERKRNELLFEMGLDPFLDRVE